MDLSTQGPHARKTERAFPGRTHDHDDRDAVVQAFALSTPYHAAQALGLELGPHASPRRRSVRVLCPWHPDQTPSCDLTIKRGRVVAICRSCGARGDVLGIVAARAGLDPRRHFGEVLARAAQIVGVDTRAARRAVASGELSPVDRARLQLQEARAELGRVEGELRAMRIELGEARAEHVARVDALQVTIAGLSETIAEGRAALPALQAAAEGPSRARVREAIAALAGALGAA